MQSTQGPAATAGPWAKSLRPFGPLRSTPTANPNRQLLSSSGASL